MAGAARANDASPAMATNNLDIQISFHETEKRGYHIPTDWGASSSTKLAKSLHPRQIAEDAEEAKVLTPKVRGSSSRNFPLSET
jgi:hypothetical protein